MTKQQWAVGMRLPYNPGRGLPAPLPGTAVDGDRTMGRLTTHILDTASGRPGAGIGVRLFRGNGGDYTLLREAVTNSDGRCDLPLLEGKALTPGRYRLVFCVAPYFAARGLSLPDPPFVEDVTLDFGIADANAHYHVPLLVSPWSYATYRGS